MLDGLEGWHIVIIVGIIAVLFGSAKLPAAARSMGQSLRIFKAEMKAGAQDDQAAPAAAAPAQAPVAPQVIEGTVVTPAAATAAAPAMEAAPQNLATPQ